MSATIPESTARLELVLGKDRLGQIQNSCVMVLGLGGVGSNCVQALARGGVGSFVLVDADAVEASNLNRQAIAYVSTIGKRKVDVTKEMILDINPDAHVFTLDAFLLKDNVDEQLSALPKPDVVVDAIDTISAKLAVVAWCQKNDIYLISSMGGGNKIHPELLEITTLSKTHTDALARVMRKESKKRGLADFRVLYSPEPARPVFAPEGATGKSAKLGTMSYYPPIMGQMIASDVILHLSGLDHE